MADRMRKLMVVGLFAGVIGGLWALGALKAELETPADIGVSVDQAVITRALRAAREAEAPTEPIVDYTDLADSGGFSRLFSG